MPGIETWTQDYKADHNLTIPGQLHLTERHKIGVYKAIVFHYLLPTHIGQRLYLGVFFNSAIGLKAMRGPDYRPLCYLTY